MDMPLRHAQSQAAMIARNAQRTSINSIPIILSHNAHASMVSRHEHCRKQDGGEERA
jgi:hypothetical protein